MMKLYRLTDITEEELLKLNFERYKYRGVGSKTCIMKIPVYKEKDTNRIVLRANIIVHPDPNIRSISIDVYDNDYNKYTPWYMRDYSGKNEVVDTIDETIFKKLKTLFGDKLRFREVKI